MTKAESLEEIITWVAKHNDIYDFLNKLKERLESYYEKVTIHKWSGEYYITDRSGYISIISIGLIDFNNLEAYITITAEIKKIIRIKFSKDN